MDGAFVRNLLLKILIAFPFPGDLPYQVWGKWRGMKVFFRELYEIAKNFVFINYCLLCL